MSVETHIHAFPRHVSGTTYPEAVPVYDRSTKRIRIGDGTTANGTEVPNMADVSGKANQSDLSALTTRVSTAESNIAGKANQSALSALTSRVSTAESNIAGKASAADLSALADRVTAAEEAIGSFESQARAILGEVSQ